MSVLLSEETVIIFYVTNNECHQYLTGNKRSRTQFSAKNEYFCEERRQQLESELGGGCHEWWPVMGQHSCWPWSHDYGLPTSSGLRSHDINLSQSQDLLKPQLTILS